MILNQILEQIIKLEVGDLAEINARKYGYAPRSLALLLRDSFKQQGIKHEFVVSVDGDSLVIRRKYSSGTAAMTTHKSVLSSGEALQELPRQNSVSSSAIRTTLINDNIVTSLMVLVSNGVIDMAELVTDKELSSLTLPSPLENVEYHQTPTGILIL